MLETNKIPKQTSSKKLSSILTLAFLQISVLILVVSVSFDTFFNFQTQQKSLAAQQRLVAQQAADTVENFIDEKVNILDTATQFTNLTNATNEEQHLVLQKLFGIEPSFRQLVILDTSGNLLSASSRVSNYALEKNSIYSKEELLTSIKKDKYYLSPVFVDQGTGEPKIIIAVPIKNVFKEVTGTLAAEVNLKFMWDLVGNIQVGKSGVVYVVNKSGDLLAFRDTARVLKRENLEKLPEVTEFIQTGDKDIIEGINISKGILNTNVVSTFVRLGNPDWAVFVELPVLEAYESIIQLFIVSVLIIVFSSLLAIVAGYYLSKKITQPLTLLIDVAEKISSGDFSKRVDLIGANEIGRLATVFNAMTGKLQELYSGLEQKVREKTAELQKEKESVEQKIVERTQQLSYEQDRLRASINSLSLGYIMTGPDNQIILINTAAENIITLNTPTAHPAQQAIDVTALRGKIDMNYLQHALNEKIDLIAQMEEAKTKKVNIILKDIPYKMLFLNLFITPVVSKQTNTTIGVVIIIEDITERKVTDRSRDEFFSIASHELRTPLTAIRGNSSLIIDYYMSKIPDPEMKSILTDIHESSLRLINIVNDFLDMSRLEQGRIQYESEAFDIIKLCEDVLKEYDVSGSRKKIYLRMDRPAEQSPLVYADRERVRQVIVNLVGNAIKFTEQGGVSLSVQVEPNHLKLFVTDTGGGIPVENQGLLFRKFQQAESNILTRDNTKGTGLGLYISRLMMKDMGGDIELVKSASGQGATFSATMPTATKSQIDEYEAKAKIAAEKAVQKGIQQ